MYREKEQSLKLLKTEHAAIKDLEIKKDSAELAERGAADELEAATGDFESSQKAVTNAAQLRDRQKEKLDEKKKMVETARQKRESQEKKVRDFVKELNKVIKNQLKELEIETSKDVDCGANASSSRGHVQGCSRRQRVQSDCFQCAFDGSILIEQREMGKLIAEQSQLEELMEAWAKNTLGSLQRAYDAAQKNVESAEEKEAKISAELANLYNEIEGLVKDNHAKFQEMEQLKLKISQTSDAGPVYEFYEGEFTKKQTEGTSDKYLENLGIDLKPVVKPCIVAEVGANFTFTKSPAKTAGEAAISLCLPL